MQNHQRILRQIPHHRSKPVMLFFTLCALSCVVAGTYMGAPTPSLPKRQTVSPDHGTINSPAVNSVIAAGDVFPFEFDSVNPCNSEHEPVTLYITTKPATVDILTSDGKVKEAAVLFDFGDFVVTNFGKDRDSVLVRKSDTYTYVQVNLRWAHRCQRPSPCLRFLIPMIST